MLRNREMYGNMIKAYPNVVSLYPNETLRLHVSTDSPKYKVQVYRQGRILERMSNFDESWKEGVNAVELEHFTDFAWPSQDFLIPSDWPSGVYIAMLSEGDALGNILSEPDVNKPFSSTAQALFVIKNSNSKNSKQILYKISLATFHAYNSAGGGSLYTGSLYQDKIMKVTIHRPGGGTGGEPWDAHIPDVYDTSSPRQTFAHWDSPFIQWLENNGYSIDYCTDMDLEEDPSILTSCNLLLSTGHDEYWSDNMRNNLERFIKDGGNVAFFSANTAWWHINFHDPFLGSDSKVHFSSFSRDMHWHEFNPCNPENRLTGVSYRNGGGWWTGLREHVGYTIHNAKHWIFAGTDIIEGMVIGKKENLIGYECDGAYFDPNGTPFVPDGSDGTPLDFTILGTAAIHNWEDLPPRENNGDHVATMGIYSSNGIVFTAATVDWTRVLAAGNNHVQKITFNILEKLKRCRGIRILGPLTDVLGEYLAVEDRITRCKVSTVSFQKTANLTYNWKIFGEVSNITPLGSYVQFGIVKAQYPITITVEVYEGETCIRFGTLTFVPISEKEYRARQSLYSHGEH